MRTSEHCFEQAAQELESASRCAGSSQSDAHRKIANSWRDLGEAVEYAEMQKDRLARDL